VRDFPDIRWILAHAGGTFPYLSTRLRLVDELETHTPPFSNVGTGTPFHQRFPEGVRPWLDRFYYDVALSGGDAPMAALTALAGPARILYGSDWPFVERGFVIEQLEDLMRMPPFAAGAFTAMERHNAEALFKRFFSGPAGSRGAE